MWGGFCQLNNLRLHGFCLNLSIGRTRFRPGGISMNLTGVRRDRGLWGNICNRNIRYILSKNLILSRVTNFIINSTMFLYESFKTSEKVLVTSVKDSWIKDFTLSSERPTSWTALSPDPGRLLPVPPEEVSDGSTESDSFFFLDFECNDFWCLIYLSNVSLDHSLHSWHLFDSSQLLPLHTAQRECLS